MKRITTAICALGICLAPAGALLADEHEEGDVGRIYIVNVKDGHGEQFREGVKEWMDCYGENGGSKAWNVWWAETGLMGRYAFTTGGHKWGVFDEEEAADEACSEIFYQKFLPHIDHTHAEFTEYMPDVSYEKEGDINVVHVIDFEIKNMRRFMGAIGKVAEAARAGEWHDGHYWYSVSAGGRKASDVFVVLPEADFAGFEDDEGFWDMVEEHHGEDAMEDIRADFVATIEKSWSNIWRKVPELSYSPGDSE